MIIRKDATQYVAGGTVDPKHEVKLVCHACGYDLDEHEILFQVCADCGAPLRFTQHVKIFATTLPPARGDASI
jgi:rRNA maturation endonuclease Nob1